MKHLAYDFGIAKSTVSETIIGIAQSGVSTLLHLIFSLFFRAPIGIRGAYRLG
jgi:hypothetical protein